VTTIDSSILLGYYQARTGQASTLSSGSSTSTKVKYAPTAPWATNSAAPRASALVTSVMNGRRFINENAATLDLAGASEDYKKLFSLFQGLNALTGLAERMGAKGVSDAEKTKIEKLFTKGLSETTAYADSLKLAQLRLTRGETMLADKTAVGVPRSNYSYTTSTVHTGTSADAVEAFAGPVVFDIAVKKLNTTQNISIDLSEMGGATRSMSAVTSFINDKLAAAGVATRFQVSRTAGDPREIKTGGTTVKLPALADKYAFKVVGDSSEAVTFSAAATTPAVYVSTTAGNPDPDKDKTTDDGVFVSTMIKTGAATAPGEVGSRIFSNGLEKTVTSVKDSQVGPDGSVYMLAEVSGDVDGQAIKSATDVALLKYDSQGKLIFARTLGAVGETKANALTVSSDGKVAIAGSITGQLEGATNGPINSGPKSSLSDSFVTLFDAKGDEVWTSRRGALQADEATAVAFGDDGTLYVGGKTKSSMPGASGLGGWDGYLMALTTDPLGAPKALFTQQIGGAGEEMVNGLVVDGSTVIVAGTEDKRAVLRSYDVSGGAAVAGATRDLGDLEGGNLAGIRLEGGQLFIGGSTRNGALALGAASNAYAGGIDAFAGRLSTDLSDTSADALTYYGGANDDTVTGMAVSGGKVWLTGLAGEAMPDGSEKIAERDGYIVELDPITGTAGSAQRISGKDGYVTPTSIAVDASGASALDKLGLPKGTLAYTDSQLITSATSARAGDQFQIRTREGGPLATVTLSANDTLETLAAKVKRAGGFRAKVEVVSDGDVRRLKITPANANAQVEVLPGKNGRNLLESVGLAEGVVRLTKLQDGRTVSANGGGNVYGLGLANDISLATEDSTRNALLVLSKAMSAIRTAYKDLETAAKPASVLKAAAASGPVPTYLTNQISNYQAALERLGG